MYSSALEREAFLHAVALWAAVVGHMMRGVDGERVDSSTPAQLGKYQ